MSEQMTRTQKPRSRLLRRMVRWKLFLLRLGLLRFPNVCPTKHHGWQKAEVYTCTHCQAVCYCPDCYTISRKNSVFGYCPTHEGGKPQ